MKTTNSRLRKVWVLKLYKSHKKEHNNPGFFLTSATEKTKTQAANSSQKLKEKTQRQGGTFPFLRKTQEKNSILPIFFVKTEMFYWVPLFMPFLWTNIFKFYKFQLFFTKNIEIFRKLKKNWGEKTQNSSKKLKTQAKNSRSGRPFPRLRYQVMLKKSLL